MRLPKTVTWGLSPVPIGLVKGVSARALESVLAHHPGLFERLGEYGGRTFGVVPVDLPFVFALSPRGPAVDVLRREDALKADAVIKGPIVTLLALLEGRIDGDALFFSRQLEVSGDTEAVLALRNALDDNLIDLPADVAAAAGPFAAPARAGCEIARGFLLARSENEWN